MPTRDATDRLLAALRRRARRNYRAAAKHSGTVLAHYHNNVGTGLDDAIRIVERWNARESKRAEAKRKGAGR